MLDIPLPLPPKGFPEEAIPDPDAEDIVPQAPIWFLHSDDGTTSGPMTAIEAGDNMLVDKLLTRWGLGKWLSYDEGLLLLHKLTGVCVVTTNTEKSATSKGLKNSVPRKRDRQATSIYIQGLPEGLAETDLAQFCSRAGQLALRPSDLQPNVKIYLSEIGVPKGDGRATFLSPESVNLALRYLNDRDLNGSKVQISIAEFGGKRRNKGDAKVCYELRLEAMRRQEDPADLYIHSEATYRGGRRAKNPLVAIRGLWDGRIFDRFSQASSGGDDIYQLLADALGETLRQPWGATWAGLGEWISDVRPVGGCNPNGVVKVRMSRSGGTGAAHLLIEEINKGQPWGPIKVGQELSDNLEEDSITGIEKIFEEHQSLTAAALTIVPEVGGSTGLGSEEREFVKSLRDDLLGRPAGCRDLPLVVVVQRRLHRFMQSRSDIQVVRPCESEVDEGKAETDLETDETRRDILFGGFDSSSLDEDLKVNEQ